MSRKLQEILNLVALCEYQRQHNEYLELEEERLEEERLEEEREEQHYRRSHTSNTAPVIDDAPETLAVMVGSFVVLCLIEYWMS